VCDFHQIFLAREVRQWYKEALLDCARKHTQNPKEVPRMSQPFVGEVRLVGFNFAPVGWSTCNGALQSIAENSTLFNLIGTTYGGDGQSTFGLPDLQGRIPLHQGSNGISTYVIGQKGGVESVTVTLNQFPIHTHALQASSANASSNIPGNSTLGANVSAYTTAAPTIAMNNAMIGLSGGGSQPHENRQPFVVLNWVISMFGIYPSQS
jgi:microcystin-dependent protein